jgi:hypothetical protein
VLWLTVWTVLVLGTVVGAFFLLRSVYRSGKALGHELERAADVLDAVADRAEALQASATHPAPVELLDPEPARLRMAQVRLRRLARRMRRDERHARTQERWQSFVR